MLQNKYKSLIDAAYSHGVTDFTVQEQDNVLYVNGTTSTSVKDKLWAIYNQLDPDMRAADLVMNIQATSGGEEMYTVVKGDSLSKIATKFSGVTWKEIFQANQDQISDPDKIFPGMVLKIPQ